MPYNDHMSQCLNTDCKFTQTHRAALKKPVKNKHSRSSELFDKAATGLVRAGDVGKMVTLPPVKHSIYQFTLRKTGVKHTSASK